MSNEEEKISKSKIKPQSPCKRFKGKKLGKDEYWSPNLVMSKKIETMDIDLCDKELSNWKDGMSKKEELQDDIKPESDSYLRHDKDLEDLKKLLKEDSQDDEPLTLINAQSKGHFS
jgi:molecular chaperone GrpE (heat shock protein)